MKKNYTHVAILIDRSGSMRNIKSDVIGGFNQLIEDQKKLPGELTVTLVQFDYDNNVLKYDTLNDLSPIQEVTLLNESNYIPRGYTPLNDALGKLIHETGEKLALMKEEDRPEKVLIVSITDGLENKSIEYTKQLIKEMIEIQEKTFNWKFLYIGANQDVSIEGGSRGIHANYAFSSNSKSAKKMSKVMSATVASYRSAIVTDSYDLSEELLKNSIEADKQEAAEEKK